MYPVLPHKAWYASLGHKNGGKKTEMFYKPLVMDKNCSCVVALQISQSSTCFSRTLGLQDLRRISAPFFRRIRSVSPCRGQHKMGCRKISSQWSSRRKCAEGHGGLVTGAWVGHGRTMYTQQWDEIGWNWSSRTAATQHPSSFFPADGNCSCNSWWKDWLPCQEPSSATRTKTSQPLGFAVGLSQQQIMNI